MSGGLGPGLFICRNIVERQEGRGTPFYVALPAAFPVAKEMTPQA